VEISLFFYHSDIIYVKLILGILEGYEIAISMHLEALKLDFHEFFHFLNAEIDQIVKFIAHKIAKTTVLELLDSQCGKVL